MTRLSVSKLSLALAGTLVLSLVLGACRSEKPTEADALEAGGADAQTVPDVVRTTFQGNATAATVVTLTPNESALNVSRDASIEVEYNTSMLVDTLESAVMAFVDEKPIAGTSVVDTNQQKVTFTPTKPWPASKTIQVILNETVSTGNFLCAGAAWTFSTAP